MKKIVSLRGKKAIVTGGATGIGKALAEALAEAGAKIVVIDKIKSSIPNTDCVVADLGNRKELKRAFDESIKKLGDLDILVNNAGIQRRKESENFSLKDWDDVLEVNLSAVFQLCQMAGKIMLKKGSGKIINIASVLSFIGGYTIPAYAASKGGVVQLTKTLANEWAGKGVNVNAIAPGLIETDLNKAIIEDKKRYNKILSRIPAGRWGKPEDLKGAVLFLASNQSDYVHGAILVVDGGFLCSFY